MYAILDLATIVELAIMVYLSLYILIPGFVYAQKEEKLEQMILEVVRLRYIQTLSLFLFTRGVVSNMPSLFIAAAMVLAIALARRYMFWPTTSGNPSATRWQINGWMMTVLTIIASISS
jgi:hypothetical protein